MAIVPVVVYPTAVLRTAATEITDFGQETQTLIDDLLDTMEFHHGAGLAAPQIGVSKRAFSFNCGGFYGHIINPLWHNTSEVLQTDFEGCLSVPGFQAECTRFAEVTVTGVDRFNSPITISASEIMARAIQHETDHLDGVMYMQRLTESTRKETMKLIRNAQWFIEGIEKITEAGSYPTVSIPEVTDGQS